MKQFLDSEAWSWIKTIIEILLIVAVVYGVVTFVTQSIAEEEQTAYVICSDFVNVRPCPNKKGEEIGRLEAGDSVVLDGKKKNGYLHCIDLSFEQSEGWIYKGYIVYDKPEFVNQNATVVSKGRLAARRYIAGKRIRWIKPLTTIKVYYWSEEWCVTNKGYIMSKYLEFEGE